MKTVYFLILLILCFGNALPLQQPIWPSTATLAPFSEVETIDPSNPIIKVVNMNEVKDHPERFFDFSLYPNQDSERIASNFQSLFYTLFSLWSFERDLIEVEINPETGKIKRFANQDFRESLRENLFSGLYQLLDRFEGKMSTLKYKRKEQTELAKLMAPSIEKWVKENRLKLQQLLPFLVELPEGNAGYARNEALFRRAFTLKSRPYYSIYSHAWPAQGETDFHNHGGALAFTAAVMPGFKEIALNPTSKNLEKPWDNQIHQLKATAQTLTPGEVNYLTRGENSNHKIRNTTDQLGIMIEIYIWGGPHRGIKRVNNSIPVEGNKGHYLILNVPVGEMPYTIADRIRSRNPKQIEEETFVQEVMIQQVLFTENFVGIFTNNNTVILNHYQITPYLLKYNPDIYKAVWEDEGITKTAYLLVPTEHPIKVEPPSLAVAKAL